MVVSRNKFTLPANQMIEFGIQVPAGEYLRQRGGLPSCLKAEHSVLESGISVPAFRLVRIYTAYNPRFNAQSRDRASGYKQSILQSWVQCSVDNPNC